MIRGPKLERIEPKILSPAQRHDFESLADRLKSGEFTDSIFHSSWRLCLIDLGTECVIHEHLNE